jgi:hypothetical protein
MVQRKCELEEMENRILHLFHLSNPIQQVPDQKWRKIKSVVKEGDKV